MNPNGAEQLPPLGVDDFAQFFDEVWGVGSPFPWQIELLHQVEEERRWPELIDLPTGSGKTSLLDIAVFLLALGADLPALDRWMPRRSVLVVDRRVIVDQAAERGARILAALQRGGGVSDVVAARLRALSGDGPPLVTGVLRGGVERNEDWSLRPDVPALQIGRAHV